MGEKRLEPPEVQLANALGTLIVANARALAALAEAIGKQPGVDRTKLMDDWFAIIPKADDVGEIERVFYSSLDHLTADPPAQQPARDE